jgi:hypothetical protein
MREHDTTAKTAESSPTGPQDFVTTDLAERELRVLRCAAGSCDRTRPLPPEIADGDHGCTFWTCERHESYRQKHARGTSS